jgi:hypothetical protein
MGLLLAALTSPARAQPAPPDAPPPAPGDAPPPATPPPGGASPASGDVDLAALGLDPASQGTAFDDKLNIYGFADFGWTATHWTESNPILSDTTTFAIGNLNLYVAKNLAPSWRMLAEVRFMYTPNGTGNGDGSVRVTTGDDPNNFGRPIEWGTISIERAYAEYDLHPRLTVRAGHWLTPYGIWNIDHGSPVIVGVFRPYIVGEALFPEHQTGLDLFGSAPIGDYKLGYHATLSNGRNQTEATADTDRRPAFGGRLELEAPLAGTARIGASGYHGRYTSATTNVMTPPEWFDETSVGGDAQWDHGALHVQSEVLVRHKAYVDGHRPLTFTGAPQEDGTDFGIYGLIGYRFTQLWNVMPFAFYEYYAPLVPGLLGDINGFNVGLNFRPAPTVVLKLQGAYAWGPGALIDTDVLLFTTQASYVF